MMDSFLTSPSSPPVVCRRTNSCFVYQVVVDKVQVFPSLEHPQELSGTVFYRGDLVSVDRLGVVVPAGSRTSSSSCRHQVALHLSDNSGWLLEYETSGSSSNIIDNDNHTSIRRLEPISVLQPDLPVAVYVDNYPSGLTLLRHPTDHRSELEATTSPNSGIPVRFLSLQKLYSDAQVTCPKTGVTFYRVQGRHGWLPDKRRRIQQQRQQDDVDDEEEDDEDDIPLLLRSDQMETGDFCYVALRTAEVRNRPNVGQASRTGCTLARGDLALVNAVRASPYFHEYGNGPFLHLAHVQSTTRNSSSTGGAAAAGAGGWLFEQKYFGRVLERVTLETGTWQLTVQAPHGVRPLHNASILRVPQTPHQAVAGDAGAGALHQENKKPMLYPCHSILECNARTESPISGAYFYRIVLQNNDNNNNLDGGDCNGGWVCDRCVGDNQPTLLVPATVGRVPFDKNATIESEIVSGWTPDFVRGIAAPIAGLVETGFDAQHHWLSFHRPETGADIHVNYSTRTVVTSEPSILPQTPITKSPYYQSKIQHLFSPFPDLQPPTPMSLRPPPPLPPPPLPTRISHCSAKQLADVLNGVLRVSATSADTGSNNTQVSSSPFLLNGRHRDGGILLGAREQAAAAYDPLAQPVPASYSASSTMRTTPMHTPTAKPSRSAPVVVSSSTASIHNNGLDHDDDAFLPEFELRRQFLECEQELTQVHERHAQLLQSIQALDEKNAHAAAKLLGQQQQQRQQQHQTLPSPQQQQQPTPQHQQQREETAVATSLALSRLNDADTRLTGPSCTTPTNSVATRKPMRSRTRVIRPTNNWHNDDKRPSAPGAKHQRAMHNKKKNGIHSNDEELGELMNHVCGECEEEFPTARSRSQHCLSVHGLYSCNYCVEVFDTVEEQNMHRDSRDHW